VRVTGGVFRSALWREAMAAMLARRLEVVGEAEGTALGAAALGVFALGRAPTLTEARDLLSAPGAPAPEVVEPDAELVATYDRLRQSVPTLIHGLDRVTGLFGGGRDRGPAVASR
jgi:gluconokinase